MKMFLAKSTIYTTKQRTFTNLNKFGFLSSTYLHFFWFHICNLQILQQKISSTIYKILASLISIYNKNKGQIYNLQFNLPPPER